MHTAQARARTRTHARAHAHKLGCSVPSCMFTPSKRTSIERSASRAACLVRLKVTCRTRPACPRQLLSSPNHRVTTVPLLTEIHNKPRMAPVLPTPPHSGSKSPIPVGEVTLLPGNGAASVGGISGQYMRVDNKQPRYTNEITIEKKGGSTSKTNKRAAHDCM